MDTRDLKAIFWMATTCFALCLILSHADYYFNLQPPSQALQSVVDFLRKNTILLDVLRISLFIGLFISLFQLMLQLYSWPGLWGAVNRERSLNGSWIYVFVDEGLNTLIFGMFTVRHGVAGLSFHNGRCWYAGESNICDATQRAFWMAPRVAFGEDLWVPYDLTLLKAYRGTHEKSYHGVMNLWLEDDHSTGRRKTLCGSLRDHNADIAHQGPIFAARLLAKDRGRLKDLANLPALIQEYMGYQVSAA